MVGFVGVILLALAAQWTVAQDTPPVRAHNTHGAPAILHASIHNQASEAAGTDLLDAAITPKVEGSVLRVTVCLTTSSVFSVIDSDGTTTFVQDLNGGTALTAGARYAFTIGSTRKDHTYDFELGTASVIETLQVEEVVGEGF